MMKAQDVKFTLDDGTTYTYMLARTEEGKAWKVDRVFTQPPSIIKYQIEMTIAIGGDRARRSGALQLRRVKQVIEDLEVLIDETADITLTGLDDIDYYVSIDPKGLKLDVRSDESNRDCEYNVTLLCWGFYKED